MSTPLQSPAQFDLRRTLLALKDEIFYSFNCIQIGEVVSFDTAKQTARVKLLIRRVVLGRPTDYPILADCPVFIYSGGVGSIAMPVAPGDPCLVLFCDRDIDNWFVSGQVSGPNSPRAHDLSDGLVLVGFRPVTKAISDYNPNQITLRHPLVQIQGNASVKMASSGSFTSSDGKVVTVVDGIVVNIV